MVADMVPICERIVDIGTDHAFIPIYLIAKNRCSFAIASDIRKGPAAIAKSNVDAYQMEDQIKVVVGDGLGQIQATMEDCVVIAGMGGYEISSILKNDIIRTKAIVLQPQKSFKELRTFLSKEGYEIKSESIAKEKDRYYLGMSVTYTGISYEMTQLELEVGPCILRDRPLHFNNYLNQCKRRLEKQVIGDASIQDIINRLVEFENQR